MSKCPTCQRSISPTRKGTCPYCGGRVGPDDVWRAARDDDGAEEITDADIVSLGIGPQPVAANAADSDTGYTMLGSGDAQKPVTVAKPARVKSQIEYKLTVPVPWPLTVAATVILSAIVVLMLWNVYMGWEMERMDAVTDARNSGDNAKRRLAQSYDSAGASAEETAATNGEAAAK